MLAAWLEHALRPEEQEQVVRHMAVCAQCREVAFLSLPAEQEAALLRTLPARKSFWLMGLRWATLATVMLVITVLALRQPWRAETNLQAKNQSAPAATAALTIPNAGTSSQTGPSAANEAKTDLQVVQNSGRTTHNADQTALLLGNQKQETVALDRRPGFLNDQRFKPTDDKDREDSDRSASVIASAPPLLVTQSPAQFPSITGGSQPGGAANLLNGLTVSGPGLVQPAPMPPTKSNFKTFAHPLSRVKRWPMITAEGLTAMGGPDMFRLPQTTSFSQTASYRPTSPADKSGIVSAENSGLRDSKAFTMSARASLSAMPAIDWKIEDGRLLKSTATNGWVDGYPHRDGFSAVTAHGNDVWAGGAQAVLFHSRDGGVEWESVKLGEGASGAVDQITVQGASVIVKTSAQQTWSSPDGGKTWKREPSN